MLRHKRFRRAAALVLVAVGALLMWLSPETAIGVLLLAFAIALESVGIWLDRKREE